VDARTEERPSTTYPLGALVAEGKTKTIHQVAGRPELVVLTSKDDITAGDGAKHDIIPDKGRLANTTTCNVFRLLKACGLPVAFEAQAGPTSFVAPQCRMLPYEVVVRREAHGSYLKRNPHFAKGQLFPQLIVELFLKTKDRNWKGKPLVCDDPLLSYAEGASQIRLFNPAKPIQGQEPFLVLAGSEVFDHDEEWKLFPQMRRVARHAFLVLEKAWQLEGGTLVDFKVEFGFDSKGQLLLADVVDNDSWRVIENGAYIDKQVYRDGGALDDVTEKYRQVADITGRFQLPRQRIILWRGSDKDKTDAFSAALGDLHDLLGAQGAGQRGRHPASDGAGGAGLGHDRLYRALERRRSDALRHVDDSGDHGAGQHQGVSRGYLVVVARPEQRAGDDGARAVQCRAGRHPDSLGAQSTPVCARARRDREPHGQYDSDLER
jgi:phosphoribosylaminoimidazole-succinocarboxamide synthase